jgi:hypothetical protein
MITYLEDLEKIRREVLFPTKEPIHKGVVFCNMDEMTIFLDSSGYTYEFKGKKQISILGPGGGKIRFTAVLAILSDGNTLPPLLIFKSKKSIDSKIVEQFKHLAMIESNSKGWNNTELTKLWVEKVWRSYQVPADHLKVLIWDRFTVHCAQSVKSVASSFSKVYYIPSGCTSILQPLDTHVNRSVKARFRYYFEKWLRKTYPNPANQGTLKPPPFDEIIFWVLLSIENVKESLIKESFDFTGK